MEEFATGKFIIILILDEEEPPNWSFEEDSLFCHEVAVTKINCSFICQRRVFLLPETRYSFNVILIVQAQELTGCKTRPRAKAVTIALQHGL